MRTTLTIDDDVAATIERLRRGGDANLRDVINEALRRGLQQMTERPKPRPRFETRTVSLGRLRVGSLDNIADVLALIEGEAFR